MYFEKNPCVYMVASKKDGVIYIGVTSNLIKRIYEHKNNILKGFTSQYHVHKLVWYEIHSTMESAITREKKMKKWQRELKVKLIEKENPNWNDLYETLF